MPDEFVGSTTPADATPSAPAPAAIPQDPAAAITATPSMAPQAPARSGAPEGYVPSYRIRETREAALREAQSEFSRKEVEYQAKMQQIQSQLHALVGLTPSNQNPEIDAIRQQFNQLYPGLSKLEAKAQDLLSMTDRSQDLEAQNNHYWQTYGRQQMDRLFKHAEESLGSGLTDEGKRQLHSSFVGFIQSSPELSDRYANDPTIVEEFWKQFTSSFIDPVRRSAAATVQGRAPQALPQDTSSGVPRSQPVPQHANLDDRVSAGWQVYQSTMRK